MQRSIKRVALGVIFLCILLSSCLSSPPSPIIIRPIPELTKDITTDEAYMKESSILVVKLGAYIEELINQVKHKVPYVDLRKGCE